MCRRYLFYLLQPVCHSVERIIHFRILPVSEALVHDTADTMVQILSEIMPPAPELFPGYRLRIVAGNKIAATDRRLKELREQDVEDVVNSCVIR